MKVLNLVNIRDCYSIENAENNVTVTTCNSVTCLEESFFPPPTLQPVSILVHIMIIRAVYVYILVTVNVTPLGSGNET